MSDTGQPPPEIPKIPLDPNMAKRGLALLRQIAKGNAGKDDAIRLQSIEGEILRFEAYSVFRIRHSLNQRVVNGRQQGAVLGSEDELQRVVAAEVENAARDPGIRQMTTAPLEQRPDKGYAIAEKTIQLPQAAKQYVVIKQCAACHGAAGIQCAGCKGQGRTMCTRCHGTHELICPGCRGQRVIRTQAGQSPCTKCRGRGRISCTFCQARGFVQCAQCRATGKAPCQSCGGTGWHSILASLTFMAEARFEYQKTALPREAVRIIDRMGPRLASGGHASVDIVRDAGRLEALKPHLNPDEYMIVHAVQMPFATANFIAGKKKMSGIMYGLKPAFSGLPNFLEAMIAPATQVLEHAASGRGDAAALLKRAMRTRALHESVMGAASMPLKNALQIMMRKYPCGISRETLIGLLQLSDRALKNLTRRSRMIGLGAGLLASALLYTAYYFGPLRDIIAPHLPTTALRMMVDIGLVILGGVITTAAIQLMAKRTLQTTLGGGKSNRHLMPKAGQSALWGYIGGLAIYFTILEASIFAGREAPVWHQAITRLIGL